MRDVNDVGNDEDEVVSATPTKNEGGDDAEQKARDDVEDVGKRDADKDRRRR
jgi:hypothetical protein